MPSQRLTYTQVFEELCPIYMAYGMTYEQFWYDDPWIVRAYAQAYLLKRRIANETAWIHGAYVYNAMSAVMATSFGKHKENYLAKPVDLFPKTEAEKEEEKRQERRKVIKYLDRLRIKKNTGVGQNVSEP